VHVFYFMPPDRRRPRPLCRCSPLINAHRPVRGDHAARAECGGWGRLLSFFLFFAVSVLLVLALRFAYPCFFLYPCAIFLRCTSHSFSLSLSILPLITRLLFTIESSNRSFTFILDNQPVVVDLLIIVSRSLYLFDRLADTNGYNDCILV
jgi:hypothetical protein